MNLSNYTCNQIINLFPDSNFSEDLKELESIQNEVEKRLQPILSRVKLYDYNFDRYHSLQYATYLYITSNILWKTGSTSGLADKIFCLNKSMNAIEINYAVTLPNIFFLSHTVGTVLGQAHYGNELVIFQNVTVGRIGDRTPVIGNKVILYPQVIVSGSTQIGDNCVISSGCHLHNCSIPDNTKVLNKNGDLVFTPSSSKYIELYLN